MIAQSESIQILRIAKFKARGNAHFKESNYRRALQCYGAAVQPYSDATSQKSMSGELASQILHCVNNSATALEKLGEFKDAKEQCVIALQLDPDNLKALLRASRISIAQGEFDEAELAIEVRTESSWRKQNGRPPDSASVKTTKGCKACVS